jgi:hypothetical protein
MSLGFGAKSPAGSGPEAAPLPNPHNTYVLPSVLKFSLNTCSPVFSMQNISLVASSKNEGSACIHQAGMTRSHFHFF